MNWLSIVILAIPVLCIYNGLHRGMVKTAFALISLVLTMVLAIFVNPYVTNFLEQETPIYSSIQKKCSENISETLETQLDQKISGEEQNQFIQQLPLPETIKTRLIKNNNETGYNQVLAETFGEYLAHSIAQIIVGIISMVLTFILVSVVVRIVAGILDRIFSFPGLSFINRLGGALLGAIQGIFVVWIIFLVFMLLWNAEWAKMAVSMIEENSITAYLYDNNFFAHFLLGIL